VTASTARIAAATAEPAPAETADERVDEGRKGGKRRWLGWLLVVLGTALAFYLVYRTLQAYSLSEILASLRQMDHRRLAYAFLFAAGSYSCLTFSDVLSLRYVGKPLPYLQTALAAFVSLSIGHSVGFAGLSSGAIRYRFYLRWGLTAEEVTKLVLFGGITVALGLAGLGGIALLANPEMAQQITGLSRIPTLMLGTRCLAACASYIVLARILRRPFKVWRWSFQLPAARLALAQIVVGTVNFSLVSACLHQTLLSVGSADYLAVVSAYVLANVATPVTHVPGGLGVIESVVTYAMPGAQVLGAVLVFRVVYFLVPLAIGGVVFGLSKLTFRARDLRDRETD